MNENNAITFDEDEIMQIADFIAADPEKQDEAWKITDDGAADWAVRKIKEEQAEYFRLNELANDRISEINAQIEAAEKRMQNRTGYLKSKLSEYFRTVPHRETKTQEQYQLLSGKLVYTKEKQTMEKDDESFLKYLKDSGNTGYIQTVEKPMWGEYKKQLTIVGDKAIDTVTGEVVDCIRVETKPATFDVK